MNCITRNARVTVSVKFIPSPKFAFIRLFNVWIDLAITLFPVCIRDVQCNLFRNFDFCKSAGTLWSWMLPLCRIRISNFIPYRLKLLEEKFLIFFVSKVLQISADGHLLNLFTAMSIFTLPFRFLLSSFPVKSYCISRPGSDSFSIFP